MQAGTETPCKKVSGNEQSPGIRANFALMASTPLRCPILY